MRNTTFLLRKFNVALLLGGAIFGLAVSAQAGPVAAGANKPSKAAGPNEKVTICHNGHEINVSINASKAHLAHGDQLGSCSPTSPGTDPGTGTDPGPIIWARHGKAARTAHR
jgi:hypothetical protein